jgi:hypothetical protein
MMCRLIVSIFTVGLFASVALAADISGIWVGQDSGRGGPQDIAFRLKVQGAALTGTMFGDEFDIPIGEGSIAGDQIRFTVTTTNYYSGSKTVFRYAGTLKEGELELVRERVPTPDDKPSNRGPGKQTLKLKRIG